MSLFLAGLVGGLTHCVAMCGPFVMSQSGDVKKLSHAVLLPYHLGRITTYVTLAVLLSSILNLAFLFLPIRSFVIAPILFTAGTVFFVSAFPVLGKLFPWTQHVRVFVPYAWVSKGFAKLSKGEGHIRKYFMGVLLGFMPCGLVVSAIMASATAPNIFEAGFAMAMFGFGTMPALIFLALGGQLLKVKFPLIMHRVTQVLMVLSGVWLFALAGMVLV